jgi:hypothetical protein
MTLFQTGKQHALITVHKLSLNRGTTQQDVPQGSAYKTASSKNLVILLKKLCAAEQNSEVSVYSIERLGITNWKKCQRKRLPRGKT